MNGWVFTTWIHHVVANAPEIFIFLAVAIGTLLGRIRIRGFAIGATACTLIVAVALGQLGGFVIPPLLRSGLARLTIQLSGWLEPNGRVQPTCH